MPQLSVIQSKGPAVAGTDDAVVFDPAAGEVGAGVGTAVVQHVDLAAVKENGELKSGDLDVLSLALAELRQFTQGRPGHSVRLVYCAAAAGLGFSTPVRSARMVAICCSSDAASRIERAATTRFI